MGKTLNLLCIERNSSEKQEENMNHTDYDNYEVLYDFDESEIESDL